MLHIILLLNKNTCITNGKLAYNEQALTFVKEINEQASTFIKEINEKQYTSNPNTSCTDAPLVRVLWYA